MKTDRAGMFASSFRVQKQEAHEAGFHTATEFGCTDVGDLNSN